MTLLNLLTLLQTTLNLSPELINRHVALKSLLDLGDMNLVAAAASRLESSRKEPEISGIFDALQDHRYAEASGIIDKPLSDGTRLARPGNRPARNRTERVQFGITEYN